ncbi:ImuA family protein [Thermaurantiacus sp.]
MDRFAQNQQPTTARAHLRTLETLRASPRPPRPRVPLGDRRLDAATAGGLARGALHALTSAGPGFATATLLAARLAARAAGEAGWTIWCLAPGERAQPFPPALVAAGLDPARLVFVEARDLASRLMAIEEASGVAAAAILEARLEGEALMRVSRRLQLAAERSGALLLWLSPTSPEPMVAATRWRLHPVPSAIPQLRPLFAGPGGAGLGPLRFRLELARGRGLPAPRDWIVEMSDDRTPGTAGLAVVADLADGPAPAGPSRRTARAAA